MEPWRLVVILVFSLVLRGFFSVVARPYMDAYAIDLAGQSIFNLSLFSFACWEFKLNVRRFGTVIGKLDWEGLGVGVGMGIVLLMFTFGQSALATLIIAQYDPVSAYELGHFHEAHYGALPFLSADVILFVLASACMPAVFEEFFFRGLLFPALANKRNYLRAILICSSVFAALHFKSLINLVNAFFFGIVACMLYMRRRSLYSCVAMHSTYNFLAFIVQHYFDFHRTRSIAEISSVFDWTPQFVMLGISMMTLAGCALGQRSVRPADSQSAKLS